MATHKTNTSQLAGVTPTSDKSESRLEQTRIFHHSCVKSEVSLSFTRHSPGLQPSPACKSFSKINNQAQFYMSK